jgi:hypothetical protein
VALAITAKDAPMRVQLFTAAPQTIRPFSVAFAEKLTMAEVETIRGSYHSALTGSS